MNADGSVLCPIHQTMLRFETDGNGYLLESCDECERDARRRKLMAHRVTLAQLPAALIQLRGDRTYSETARAIGIPGKGGGDGLRRLELGAKPRLGTVKRLEAAGIVITDLRKAAEPKPVGVVKDAPFKLRPEILEAWADALEKPPEPKPKRPKPKRRPGSMAPPPTAWHRVRNYLRRVLDRLNDPSN